MNPRSLILATILGTGAIGFSMLGQGGGVLYTPIQVLFGVDFHTAVFQSLWFTILTALPAVLLFRKTKQVDWAVAAALESTSFAGAFLSGYFANIFPPQALTVALAILVFAAGTSMLLKLGPRKEYVKRTRLDWMRELGGERYRINLGQGLPISFLIGIASGLTGAAGGFLKIPMLIRLFGMPISVAFGSSALMVSLTAAGGLLGHLATGVSVWHEPLLLSAFVLLGSQIGPRLTMQSRPLAMRKRFATYLIALACLVMASSFFVTPSGELARSLFS